MAAEAHEDEVQVRSFGQYIVADPRICHGKLTFRGTRIFVDDVLEQVAADDDWDKIVQNWGGKVPREAISEAVDVARRVLVSSHEEWRQQALAQLEAIPASG